ncbi:MAG: trigger factor [Candidatus Saccharibacteria bacterium]|nr:trigger factor [Candidatus Saccharibacteria bacterium]
MKVTTKKLSDTKVELTVTLDKAELEASEKVALERLAKEVRVQGFRDGKVPMSVAKKHINEQQLIETTLDHAVRVSVPRAFHESGRQAIVIPEVSVTKYVPNDMAEYTATAEVLPEVKLADYKHLKAKYEDVKVAKKDIDEVIEQVREAYSETKVVKRAAKEGDDVTIDFEGTKDGKKFDGGAAKDYKLRLGSHQFIPGFEEGCVGHEAGDRFDIPVTFPKDYHNADLAGAKANFNVLIKQVNELTKPELDDKFAKKCGPFKTIDELRKDIEKNLASQNKVKTDNIYKDALIAEIVKGSKVAAPEIMVKDQLKMMKNDLIANLRSQGLTFEEALQTRGMTEEDWEKETSPVAADHVKASLCLQLIARDEKIEAEEELVDAKLAELREIYKKSKEAIESLKNPQVRMDIKNRLTIDKTLNWLVETNRKSSK